MSKTPPDLNENADQSIKPTTDAPKEAKTNGGGVPAETGAPATPEPVIKSVDLNQVRSDAMAACLRRQISEANWTIAVLNAEMAVLQTKNVQFQAQLEAFKKKE